MQQLWKVNIGSHMWRMEKPTSDLDLAVVYAADWHEIFLGKTFPNKQTQENGVDTTFCEIEELIKGLITGKAMNYYWFVVSPIIMEEYQTALVELRQIISENLTKNVYNSIQGMAMHNIYHFIQHPDKLKQGQLEKKLNVIGRGIKQGQNLFLYNKILFEKTDIKTKDELDQLITIFNEAYKSTNLPIKPDAKRYEDYLLKWRLRLLDKSRCESCLHKFERKELE